MTPNKLQNSRIGFALGASAVMLAVVVTGCTLGPEPHRPATAADVGDTYIYAAGQEVASAIEDDHELPAHVLWWQRFGDDATSELVELALVANTDLQAAAARVLEAEAMLRSAGGARLPQVNYGLSANRSRNSFVLPEIGRISPESTNPLTKNFSTSWIALRTSTFCGRNRWTTLCCWTSNRRSSIQ